jgi:hypothetical protein
MARKEKHRPLPEIDQGNKDDIGYDQKREYAEHRFERFQTVQASPFPRKRAIRNSVR